jgi:beclin 1
MYDVLCQSCGGALVLLPPDEAFKKHFSELQTYVNGTDEDSFAPDSRLLQDAVETVRNIDDDDDGAVQTLLGFAAFCSPLSGESPIGQPLCTRCALRDEGALERQLEEATTCGVTFQRFIEGIHSDSTASPSVHPAENDAALEAECVHLKAEIHATASSRAKVEACCILSRQDRERLRRASKSYWEETRTWELRLENRDQAACSLAVRERRLDDDLLRLKRTHVFNDAFHIWHDGTFGSINGFRLGRLPSRSIEYAETNAAWGQAATLLAALSSRQAGFRFAAYRVVPMGSYSKVVRVGHDRSSAHPLFWEGGWRGKSGYNRAMLAFLGCLDELGKYAESQDRTINMPYAVHDGQIGGCAITLGDWHVWTMACKRVLTNLKWLVAFDAKS